MMHTSYVHGLGVRLLLLTSAVALLLVGLTPPPADAAAMVTLSSTSGPAGTSVTVTGAGFPKKTQGTLVTGTTSVTITTTGAGAFQSAITATGSGDLTITATAGGVSAAARFTVVAPVPTPTTTKAIRFGVGTAGGPAANGELDEVAALAGEAPSMVLSYKDFNQPAPIAELNAVRARGADTLLTWEPWTWGGGTQQPAYALDRITAGDFDAYLRQWGQALGQWGQPVYLRFAHEMNGDWYPWAEGVNGNGAGDYAAAYQHVHDVVESTGATNISWVWNPNVPYWGSTPLPQLYPGAEYVDFVALDGYNWGTSQSWSSWQEPSNLFGDGLAQLRQLAPGKPIVIAETSSSELGGSKAQWISNLVGYLSAQPDVVALVWFHINKEADWRINSTTSSADAFRSALATRR
ncbi:beta-mannanase [Arthrobacter agilis]|nr:glycosyl hydrolase [Arthrobacter agilis]OUM43198.1 beta-mannanase [Arthrobacter agilis]PPB47680.1 beta-mannanase [Arthrobacter agilis]TPV25682.1 beta-mannanase [Arthrobacter agilis]VDR33466.1 Endoglucanase H precursor [Arthrobacter agilis]